MELWIRSQKSADIIDRLIKVEEISIDTIYENDMSAISVNGGIDVGYYYSEERVLEVLDEIQEILSSKLIVNTNSTYVYQMPEE